jgi:hypothetical protein
LQKKLLEKVDYLVSWNFKHIVNVFRIKGYNAVNMKNGYIQLDNRSPKEIIRICKTKKRLLILSSSLEK